jgi:hypothetical protein
VSIGKNGFCRLRFPVISEIASNGKPASDMQNQLTLTAALTSSCAPWNNVGLYAARRTITISARL